MNKKLLFTALMFLGTVSAAFANPVLGPISAPVPHVFSMPVSVTPVKTSVINGYRAIRSFWLTRGIVR